MKGNQEKAVLYICCQHWETCCRFDPRLKDDILQLAGKFTDRQIGTGFYFEFVSVIQAVKCAIEIIEEFAIKKGVPMIIGIAEDTSTASAIAILVFLREIANYQPCVVVTGKIHDDLQQINLKIRPIDLGIMVDGHPTNHTLVYRLWLSENEDIAGENREVASVLTTN